jgi:hypothetical protein
VYYAVVSKTLIVVKLLCSVEKVLPTDVVTENKVFSDVGLYNPTTTVTADWFLHVFLLEVKDDGDNEKNGYHRQC